MVINLMLDFVTDFNSQLHAGADREYLKSCGWTVISIHSSTQELTYLYRHTD